MYSLQQQICKEFKQCSIGLKVLMIKFIYKSVFIKKLQLQIKKPGLASATFTLRMVVLIYDQRLAF